MKEMSCFFFLASIHDRFVYLHVPLHSMEAVKSIFQSFAAKYFQLFAQLIDADEESQFSNFMNANSSRVWFAI